MAGLTSLVRGNVGYIRSGMEWLIIYKNGRSWASYLLPQGLKPELSSKKNEFNEILKTDPNAILINGEACGFMGTELKNLTVEKIRFGIEVYRDNSVMKLSEAIRSYK